MIASYKEQIERLRARIEERDRSQVHFLDVQANGTFLDTDTKIVYKDWKSVEKQLSGTIIVDDIPEDVGGNDDCE